MTTTPTIPAESEDLKTHVDLCETRYRELDKKLCHLDSKVSEISQKVDDFRIEFKKILVITAGSIITSIITAFGVILVKLI